MYIFPKAKRKRNAFMRIGVLVYIILSVFILWWNVLRKRPPLILQWTRERVNEGVDFQVGYSSLLATIHVQFIFILYRISME